MEEEKKDHNHMKEIITKINENKRLLMKSMEENMRQEIYMQENLNIFLTKEDFNILIIIFLFLFFVNVAT